MGGFRFRRWSLDVGQPSEPRLDGGIGGRRGEDIVNGRLSFGIGSFVSFDQGTENCEFIEFLALNRALYRMLVSEYLETVS